MQDTKLNQLRKYYFTHHYIPSFRELSDLFHLKSPGAVGYWIHQWRSQGYIEVNKEKLIPTDKFFEFPLLGSIQAGIPIEEQESYETIKLEPFNIQNPESTFALKVRGDSMKDAGIIEGDLVILDKSLRPQNQSIIAAFVDDEWTLKYYFDKKGKIFLKAANAAYKDIFPKRKLEIGGVVIKVLREYI
ncbi:repressor LexA [Candidatus Roizmanbacteria bacterium CG_4_9_14_0_2_um_filter_39_13]|uniref:Repressor LexA n=2 Tax=Candidatus Roizmaniibacteriota TaxID=1752723 RepID=A0A2M8F325_9BACT|nr:MAG: repressor LexA [Candidatus Roizmanbacteria bacterium CG_4_10_14_0_2_um_filter_39_12]PJC33713.1 MAG: repressor LexA [Candidatus Roizmanbacteria bacterium CG_4_9_14_0_2_um_filter_39_13]PJE62051.1 MAG: repressor LexA [Candidatus Roizmanbacteria bacterium CG10_big_fil_rev_8_21_14_0_10_39_12]